MTEPEICSGIGMWRTYPTEKIIITEGKKTIHVAVKKTGEGKCKFDPESYRYAAREISERVFVEYKRGDLDVGIALLVRKSTPE